LDEIENPWIYTRFVEGKFEYIIGEPMLPDYLHNTNHRLNRYRICRMLNLKNCFDIEIKPKDRDELHLSFDKYSLFYSFVFRNNKWRSIESEPLMVEWYHDIIHYGEMKELYEIIAYL